MLSNGEAKLVRQVMRVLITSANVSESMICKGRTICETVYVPKPSDSNAEQPAGGTWSTTDPTVSVKYVQALRLQQLSAIVALHDMLKDHEPDRALEKWEKGTREALAKLPAKIGSEHRMPSPCSRCGCGTENKSQLCDICK